MLCSYKLFWASGELTAVICAFFILDSLEAGNWRGLLLIVSGFALFTFFYVYFFIDESCRWLFLTQQKEEAKEILKKLIKATDPSKMTYLEDEDKIEKMD